MNLAKALSNKAIVAVLLSALIAMGTLMFSRGWLASAQTIGPLDHITLSPATVTLTVGATQQYSAQGYDANNNAISDLTYVGTVVNGGGVISTGGLFTAGVITGNFPDTVKVTATQGEVTRTAFASVTVAPVVTTPTATPTVTGTPTVIPTATVTGTPTGTPVPTATPSATATPGHDDDDADKDHERLHKRLWHWFGHRFWNKDVRSVDSTITMADGTQHKVTVDAGTIASISAPSFTITLKGATTTKSFATDADTKFRPMEREGKKGLAGFKVGDEVIVSTMDGKVMSVLWINRPKPTVDEQRAKLKTKLDAKLDKHEEKGLKLKVKIENRLDKFDDRHDDKDDHDEDDD